MFAVPADAIDSQALFTLNSCPMFTYNERDLHRMPPPARQHLPVKQFIADSNLLTEDNAKDNEADVALLRLPAPALRGTFAKAYSLLTKLVSRIGWDELLKRRSSVFVMEEEYRLQKAGQEPRSTNAAESIAGANAHSSAPIENGAAESHIVGDVLNGEATDEVEAVQATLQSDADVESKMERLGISSDNNASSQSIPTIKISTDSDHEREQKAIDEHEESEHDPVNESISSSVSVEPPPLEKPALAQAGPAHERTDSAAQGNAISTAGSSGQPSANRSAPSSNGPHSDDSPASGSSFTNKRLCERWLDNLFMVLYEVCTRELHHAI